MAARVVVGEKIFDVVCVEESRLEVVVNKVDDVVDD